MASFAPGDDQKPGRFVSLFPDSVAAIRVNLALAPAAWICASLILAILTRKQEIFMAGCVVGILVMTSRWAAICVYALHEHPGHKRRRAMKKSVLQLCATAFGSACAAALLGYFRISFFLAWTITGTATFLQGYRLYRYDPQLARP
jgi:small-conductance mechanosensitive channel